MTTNPENNSGSDWMMVAVKPAGRRVVVVGSGAVARRRAEQFASRGAKVEVYDPALNEAAVAELGDNIKAFGRAASKNDVAGSWLVVVATDDPIVNAEVGTWAQELGIDCNRTDDAEAGTLAVPALLEDSDGWKVAVLGADAGPLFSAWIKGMVGHMAAHSHVDLVYKWLSEARAEAEKLNITSKERGFLMRRVMAQLLVHVDGLSNNPDIAAEINGAELVHALQEKRSQPST